MGWVLMYDFCPTLLFLFILLIRVVCRVGSLRLFVMPLVVICFVKKTHYHHELPDVQPRYSIGDSCQRIISGRYYPSRVSLSLRHDPSFRHDNHRVWRILEVWSASHKTFLLRSIFVSLTPWHNIQNTTPFLIALYSTQKH